EIRDHRIQSDSMRFRRNLERMGEVFAYEISKALTYTDQAVITPLGETSIPVLSGQPVLAAVLRAGLPLHQGLLNYFDRAENAFVSAYRKHHKDGGFDVEVEYISCPSIKGKVLILADPMLASGSSMVLSYKALVEYGKPERIIIASCIASAEGIEYVKRFLPAETDFWVGAVDDELTSQSYIVPGLGDAGDLAYGRKEQS
ncbi:MAG: uracil phosphoribosyltransferase, partial [Bacteroidota bacterium]